ncbi:MAG: methionyl-tRNA formyltransferase [Dictyoglomus turgidum]|uniref:methionyl-tRNA formyltransferase n=1 Tax=Dictyoglomus turgidum TaxID=513050 RepID=UPI003C73F503
MRIIYFGTPEFSRIILERIAPYLNIIAVVTQPDKPKGRGKRVMCSPVKDFAISKGIPVYQPEKLKGNKEFFEIIRSLNPEALVVASYGKIIPEDILNIPPYGGINVHASVLPKYRGAAPIERAIMNCEKETGVSIMKMERGLDTGPVYAIRKIPILPDDNRGTLSIKLAHLGAELLLEVLPLIKDGKLSPVPQEESLATYAPKLSKEEEIIDWNMRGEKIWCQIRALSPEPGAMTFFRGKILKIFKADFEEKIFNEEIINGTIIEQNKKRGIGVKVNNGILWLLELQPEGKKRMSFLEFMNGYRLNIGERFENS